MTNDINIRSKDLKFGVTKTGWMTIPIMHKWIEQVIIPHNMINPGPKLLLLDSYKPHIDPEIIDKLEENDVTAMIIPGKMTKHLQPLDISVIKSFKLNFKRLVYKKAENALSMTRREIMATIRKAMNSIRKDIIKDSFSIYQQYNF